MSARFSAFTALVPVLATVSASGLDAAERTTVADPVIITATRTLQKLEDSLSSVTVIERADIERSQARTLDEVLAGVEGVAIARQGGLGQPTSVYVRGGESDHVLWIVDGIRVGSVTTGIPALQDIPLDTVERIEIVRGARSSLYGADAMGGVAPRRHARLRGQEAVALSEGIVREVHRDLRSWARGPSRSVRRATPCPSATRGSSRRRVRGRSRGWSRRVPPGSPRR